MKIKWYTPLFIIALLVNACKKDSVSDKYKNLAPFDSKGKPNNLLKDSISPGLLSFLNDSFPDHKNMVSAHPELFTGPQMADISITQLSDVYVTFVAGLASHSNTLGFYTYPTGQPPVSPNDISLITYIFPNTGGYTPLVAGDKAKIGTFNTGTTIGFIFAQSGWNVNSHTIDNNVVHFFSTDSLNPEKDPKLKRHAVVMNYGGTQLIGFEDTDRSSPLCDNDFNDVVFYCTVAPK